MAYNKILDIKPINEEIWTVSLNNEDYFCSRVNGIAKFRETSNQKEDGDTFWTFCTYDESGDQFEIGNDRIGIIYGEPTKEKIKTCIDNKDNCKANVGGFIDGQINQLKEAQP